MSRVVPVVSAFIENDRGEILIAERPPGKHLAGYWEFPGGKQEPNETEEMALERELREELELSVEILGLVGRFPFKYEWGEMELVSFRVRALNEPRATKDVRVFKWVTPEEIDASAMTPAGRDALSRYLKISRPSPG